MCTRITINNGEIPDVETPRQFRNVIGPLSFFKDENKGAIETQDCCIPFMYEYGDYFIKIPQ